MTQRRVTNRRGRQVARDAEWLKVWRYLCIDGNGRCRITVDPPRLAADEIAMRLELALPRALFKRPMLAAKVEIPQSAVTPVRIETDVVNGIADAIKNATGLTAHIRVVEPEVQQ